MSFQHPGFVLFRSAQKAYLVLGTGLLHQFSISPSEHFPATISRISSSGGSRNLLLQKER